MEDTTTVHGGQPGAETGQPEVVWDTLPTDSRAEDAPRELWLDPADGLNASQLRTLQDVLGLHQISLVEVKKRFIDGRAHLLLKEHPNYIREMQHRLAESGIPVRVSVEVAQKAA